jgi:deoxycytidine triphosphate deaminase
MATSAHPPPTLPEFAADDADAQRRFERWRSTDPFPDVVPALLNSADLLDYIATAGILHPFAVTADTLDQWIKPASCAVGCSGDFLRYDLDPKKLELKQQPETGTLEADSRLRLLPNSITFLQLETTFRIPNYMAARFNLTIREIHRGILVGTGPLVDPGFVGRLLIPLHNLTSNEYTVAFGEPLVWVEFTKLSRNSAWRGTDPQVHEASFIDFPERKLKRKTVAAYLDHANAGMPIASSIPQEVARATHQAEQAIASVRNLRRAGVLGVVLATLAVAIGGIWPVVTLISDTNSRLDQSTKQSSKLNQEIVNLAQTVASQSRLILQLERRP